MRRNLPGVMVSSSFQQAPQMQPDLPWRLTSKTQKPDPRATLGPAARVRPDSPKKAGCGSGVLALFIGTRHASEP